MCTDIGYIEDKVMGSNVCNHSLSFFFLSLSDRLIIFFRGMVFPTEQATPRLACLAEGGFPGCARSPTARRGSSPDKRRKRARQTHVHSPPCHPTSCFSLSFDLPRRLVAKKRTPHLDCGESRVPLPGCTGSQRGSRAGENSDSSCQTRKSFFVSNLCSRLILFTMLLFILWFTQCHTYSVQFSFAISPLPGVQKSCGEKRGRRQKERV